MIEVLQIVLILLFSVICHEVAHGWVANRLGDPTARLAGRLTLNPLKHIDPLGTIVVPVVLRMLGFVPLGWAKPVPVNFSALRNPFRDMILVAAAGPAVNIGFAVLSGFLLHMGQTAGTREVLVWAMEINLILAFFNLVPIPPLDGSRILVGLFPRALARPFSRIEPYGFIIIILLLNFGFLKFIGFLVTLVAIKLGGPIG